MRWIRHLCLWALLALCIHSPVFGAGGPWQEPEGSPSIQSRADPETQKAVRLAIDGAYEEASKAFRRLLRRRPEDPLLLYYLGLCYSKMQRHEIALEYLRQAVKEEAPFPQAYYWLARTYLRLDELGRARETVEKGLDEFPRNEDLLELRAGPAHPKP